MTSTIEGHVTTISNLESSVKSLTLEKERAIKLESDIQTLQSESSKISTHNSELSGALESQKQATLKVQEEVNHELSKFFNLCSWQFNRVKWKN